jgi:hypothetical protein
MHALTEAFSRLVRRHLVTGLAWLVLVTQVSSFAHLLVVRHAVCPEHGELIHPHEGDSASFADAVVSSGVLPRVVIRASDGATDDHVHCPVAMHRRETAVLPPCASTVAPVRAPEIEVLALNTAPRPPSVALFRLAPKNSPPA